MNQEEARADAQRAEREEKARRELFAVLAHELRSPIGAILGFEELLAEGLFGEIPVAGADALARIRGSARQLLDLVAGLSDLSLERIEPARDELREIDPATLLEETAAALSQEAAGRDTRVELQLPQDALTVLHTDVERARRAFKLVLMAAIKSTAGGTIILSASERPGCLLFEIAQTRLDQSRDDPAYSLHAVEGAHLTGAGLRIAMARGSLSLIGGQLDLIPEPAGLTLRVSLPPTTAA